MHRWHATLQHTERGERLQQVPAFTLKYFIAFDSSFSRHHVMGDSFALKDLELKSF